MGSWRNAFRVALGFSAAMLPGLAAAQTTPPPVSPPTREEIERAQPAPEQHAKGTGVTVEGAIERAPCPLADPKFQDLSFTLSQVQFTGLRSVPPDILREAWTGDVGKKLPVAAICDIRDRAATILRSRGYLAAVQVPAQKIENGVVRFDVLMAKLVRIQVRGEAGRAEPMIAGYLDKIRAMDVFNVKEAERYLLLARDLPGYDVRLVLRPAGTVPGEVIGEVDVTYTPVEIDANVQNYGSRATGRFSGLVRAQFNGLTGLGDRTTLSFFTTADFKEQQVVEVGHSFKLGSEGLTLTGDFTYAWTRPSIGVNLNAETLVAYAEASYPFLRTQAENFYGAFGLNVVNQDVDFVGTPLTRDRLRVLYARFDYDSIDPLSIASTTGFSQAEPRWHSAATLELRQGIDLGSSERCRLGQVCLLSRAEGDPTAFVARGAAYFDYRPVPQVTISISPRAQYAPHALLSFEEYSVGNYTVGRGYDPGALSGDSGLGFQSELRFGSLVPKSRSAFAFQPYGFFDLGVVWNHDSNLRAISPERLLSAGAGVRAAWGDHARLDLTLAAPLDRPPFGGQRDVRFLVSLTTKLVPWRR